MDFGKNMRLLMMGMMLLASSSAYADDCVQEKLNIDPLQVFDTEGKLTGEVVYNLGVSDFLTISPSGNIPGLYDIRIRGRREVDKVEIVSVNTSVTHYYIPCLENQSEDAVCRCMRDSLIVEAKVRKGKNPGKSYYDKKFGAFVGEGLYSLYFKLSDEDGKEYFGLVVDADSCGQQPFLYVTPKPPVNLGIRRSAFEITGDDSFKLRNLAVETTDSKGVKQKFDAWGKFQWNPNSLSWELKDSGIQ